MRERRAFWLCAVLFVGMWPGTTAAQPNPQRPAAGAAARPAGPGGGQQPGRPAPPVRRGLPALDPASMTVQDIEQYFDMYVLNQARSQLQLTQEQFPTFRQRLQKLQNARRQEQRQRTLMMRELNQVLTGGTTDEAAIAAKLKEYDDLVGQASREVITASAGIDEVLTVRQRARFRVFSEMMERRKLELLARARQQPQPPAGPPPPTGPQ